MKSCEVTMLFAEAKQLRSLNIILSTPRFSPTPISVNRVSKNWVSLTKTMCDVTMEATGQLVPFETF